MINTTMSQVGALFAEWRDQLDKKIDNRIDKLEQNFVVLNKKFDEQQQNFVDMNDKCDQQKHKFIKKFDQQVQEIDNLNMKYEL